jgi:hypothetical protein
MLAPEGGMEGRAPFHEANPQNRLAEGHIQPGGTQRLRLVGEVGFGRRGRLRLRAPFPVSIRLVSTDPGFPASIARAPDDCVTLHSRRVIGHAHFASAQQCAEVVKLLCRVAGCFRCDW